jgi:hypothetical protein
VQGERFVVPSTGEEVDCPTPEIMMQNYDKWKLEMSAETRHYIKQLYTFDSDFVKSRLIKHTLMHYKSFERLFIARCGVSIASKKAIAELVASGGATLTEQAEMLMPLVSTARSQ